MSLYFEYLDVALISRFDYANGGPTAGATNGFGIKTRTSDIGGMATRAGIDYRSRIAFGWDAMTNARGVGKPYPVRNLPLFSSSNPSYVPRRSWFLARTVAITVALYLTLDVLDSFSDPLTARKFFSNANIPLFYGLDNITGEKLSIRIVSIVIAGIGLIAVQRGVYGIIAFLSVGLRLTEPAQWPPFYGPYSNLYSLRSMWGSFWHQMNTRRVSAISHWLVHDVLKLPRGNVVVRYLRAFATLLTSGILHLGVDIASGLAVHESGAIRFFCTQFVGVIIEDAAIWLYKRFARSAPDLSERSTTTREKDIKLSHRVIGMIWVVLFLSWSYPSYMYPLMYRTRAGYDDGVVPWSVIGEGTNGITTRIKRPLKWVILRP